MSSHSKRPSPQRSLVLAALLLTLTGCGYQLRGAMDLPPGLSRVYIQAPTAIRDELTLSLDASGAGIAQEASETKTRVEVSDERFSRRVLSVDPRTGKSREFELSYSLDYRIMLDEGDRSAAPRTLVLRRDYIFDEDAVLGKSREEATLQEEMRRDAVQQILRQFRSRLTQSAPSD